MARSKLKAPQPDPDDGSQDGRIPDLREKVDILRARRASGEISDLLRTLRVDQSTLNRWFKANRIHRPEKVGKLSQYFSVPRSCWKKSLEEFTRLVEGVPSATWPQLLSFAKEHDVGKIEALRRDMHALPASEVSVLNIVKVTLGSKIRATFFLPSRDNNQSKTASHWRIEDAIVLSQDPTGYLCLLPRYSSKLKRTVDQQAGLLTLSELLVDAPGLCSLILITAGVLLPLPNEVFEMLRQNLQGHGFQPVLDKLAIHLLDACREGEVNILQLRYFVV